MLKKFRDLTEKEILALAISSEEEDGRIYGEFADGLRESYPATAQMFEEMREEEVVHRDRLTAMFRERFGDHIPLDPPRKREGIFAAQADVAYPSAGRERGAEAGGGDGNGGGSDFMQRR